MWKGMWGPEVDNEFFLKVFLSDSLNYLFLGLGVANGGLRTIVPNDDHYFYDNWKHRDRPQSLTSFDTLRCYVLNTFLLQTKGLFPI